MYFYAFSTQFALYVYLFFFFLDYVTLVLT